MMKMMWKSILILTLERCCARIINGSRKGDDDTRDDRWEIGSGDVSNPWQFSLF